MNASAEPKPVPSSVDAWAAHGFTGDPALLIRETTLVNAWVKRWSEAPDQPVLCDGNGAWITAAQLSQRSRVVAGRLAGAGLQAGDRILMSCAPSVDLVVAHVAALRLGLVVVPVNTAFSARELANVLNESLAKLSVVDDPARVPHGPVVGPTIDLAVALAVELADAQPPLLDNAGSDDPAMLVFTSGTTGRPKGVMLTHANLLSSAEALRIAWRWKPTDRLVLSLPLFHMHGLGVGVHVTLLTGASAVIIPRFSVDDVLDAVGRHHATLLFGVPTMWVRILASPRVGELAQLRLCVSGSAPLAADVWQGLADRGGQQILERYGMTETVMNVSNPYDGERRPGSVGLALPGVSVRLHEVSDDGVGEIVLTGPNVFAGYWERPERNRRASGGRASNEAKRRGAAPVLRSESNADAFTADGWFRTGDLGSFDPDGYLRIVGRSKDLIITGGFNVYPRDVEDVLREHAGVADVAVAGELSSEWGETVVAYVVRADSAVDADILMGHCASRLAGYQRPRRIVFLPELPRNALGKVVKSLLP